MTEKGSRLTLLFVDEIEDGMVSLLLGETALTLPVSLLPPELREGDWIELSGRVVPAPPQDTDERRHRLAADDPGGDLKL